MVCGSRSIPYIVVSSRDLLVVTSRRTCAVRCRDPCEAGGHRQAKPIRSDTRRLCRAHSLGRMDLNAAEGCQALVQQRVYVRSARRPAPTLQRCRNCWHTKGPKPPTRNQGLPCRRPRVPARRCSSPRRSNAAEARALPCAGALSEDVQPGDDYLVKMWLHLADVCGLISR